MPIFDQEFLKTLDKLAVNLHMQLYGGMGGGRKSRVKGSSAEFSDYREYSLGDDFRRIDWNAYGRFERLFVKLFNEEREVLINIFLDTSASMDFGEPKKDLTAKKIAGALSFLALNTLDRVSLTAISGSKAASTPYFTGRGAFSGISDFLEKQPARGEANLLDVVKAKNLSSKGLTIVLSDYFIKEDPEELLKYLTYKKQEIILIQILSEEELHPRVEGQIRLVDSETGQFKEIAINGGLLTAYEKQMKLFMGSLVDKCKKYGASYIKIINTEPIEKIVFEEFQKSGIIRQVK